MEPKDSGISGDYPTPPDLQRIAAARTKLSVDQAVSGKAHSRLSQRVGQRASDVGTYTLIPSLMVAGPVVGYGLGYWVEKTFGGAPWGVVSGMLLGLLAAFRQIFLLLKRKSET